MSAKKRSKEMLVKGAGVEPYTAAMLHLHEFILALSHDEQISLTSDYGYIAYLSELLVKGSINYLTQQLNCTVHRTQSLNQFKTGPKY